ATRRGERGGEQIAVVNFVDRAELQRTRRGYRIARCDPVERFGDADETRQTLRSACTGNQSEFHFGKADFRATRGNSIVARQRKLESAAQCGTMQRNDDRFGRAFDRLRYLR